MHLVIGDLDGVGGYVVQALSGSGPVAALDAIPDAHPVSDAVGRAEVVYVCRSAWSPDRRLRFSRADPPLLSGVLATARAAGATRIVLLSTAQVLGPEMPVRAPARRRFSELSEAEPRHPYERLRLWEESWLVRQAGPIEVVIVRSAQPLVVSDPVWGRMIAAVRERRPLRLPRRGRVARSFIAGSDLGRALAAAGTRGDAGATHLVAGFDSSWAEVMAEVMTALEQPVPVRGETPFETRIRGFVAEIAASRGGPAWPNPYVADLWACPHLYDDARSRWRLVWSPRHTSAATAVRDALKGTPAGPVRQAPILVPAAVEAAVDVLVGVASEGPIAAPEAPVKRAAPRRRPAGARTAPKRTARSGGRPGPRRGRSAG